MHADTHIRNFQSAIHISQSAMKPLILWARDHFPSPYTLRMGPRTPETVSGQVKILDAWHPFVYDRQALTITIDEGEDARVIQINEWGWEQ